MNVVLEGKCKCGSKVESFGYTEFIHYVPVIALLKNCVDQSGFMDEVTKIGQTEMRSCDKKCKKKFFLSQTLMNSPTVITLGLTWSTVQSKEDIVRVNFRKQSFCV
eukprot:TRINITY_DN3587_c0_g1_i7.p1 TRINITY_DN3587_c0_g1~~TRINITY_DN3587_c0_g1_i7.p1  ORF type:complete len:106 (+),score=9.61 TRINITY_DN3587_c0_g1_i7:129-446(+)